MSATAPNQGGYQSPNGGERLGPWQEKLKDHCDARSMRAPIYSIASDRRGGRTAWSCTVDVQGLTVPARYWYDGQYVYNAKEDAAHVALERLQQLEAQQQQAQYQQQQYHPQQQQHGHQPTGAHPQAHWAYAQR